MQDAAACVHRSLQFVYHQEGALALDAKLINSGGIDGGGEVALRTEGMHLLP